MCGHETGREESVEKERAGEGEVQTRHFGMKRPRRTRGYKAEPRPEPPDLPYLLIDTGFCVSNLI